MQPYYKSSKLHITSIFVHGRQENFQQTIFEEDVNAFNLIYHLRILKTQKYHFLMGIIGKKEITFLSQHRRVYNFWK